MFLVDAGDGTTVDGVAKPLFRPPFSLFPFQAEFAARCYFNSSTILAADTGCGKSVTATATACMLFEDGKIDHVIIAAEKNKIWEWYDDIANYSALERVLYVGDKAKKAKIRENLPQVLIGTFETLRNDLAHWESTTKNKRGRTLASGPLLELLETKRVLVIMDEGPAKIGAQRSSLIYQAWDRFFTRCRKLGELKIINCSATYVDRDPVGFHNVGHLMWPERVGTVEEFKNDHIAALDFWGNPTAYKNLHPDACEPGKVSLRSKIGDGNILVKSKLDPDVKDLFPTMHPDVTFVRLSKAERDFYKWMIKEYSNSDSEKSVWMALRQFLGHPHSLFTTQGEVAQDIVRRRGVDLEALGCTKLEDLLERLRLIVRGQGAQAVVFTWFGQSVFPILAREFRKAGFTVSENHGQMTAEARAKSQASWRAGETEIFLSSDAGSRGINLPEGQYVEQYEAALKYSTYVQRVNRVSRINSVHKTVVDHTWVVKNSIEEPILELQGNRQEWSEELGTRNTLSVEAIRGMIKDRRNLV
jgi:superfamily II DNA or RNA helicase